MMAEDAAYGVYDPFIRRLARISATLQPAMYVPRLGSGSEFASFGATVFALVVKRLQGLTIRQTASFARAAKAAGLIDHAPHHSSLWQCMNDQRVVAAVEDVIGRAAQNIAPRIVVPDNPVPELFGLKAPEQVARATSSRGWTPERREATAARMRQRWQDPAFRTRVVGAVRNRTPEARAKVGARLTAHWAEPNARGRRMTAIRLRRGRPVTAVTPEDTARVDQMLQANVNAVDMLREMSWGYTKLIRVMSGLPSYPAWVARQSTRRGPVAQRVDRAARQAVIEEGADKGWSQAEIARRLGVTRERARQLMWKYGREQERRLSQQTQAELMRWRVAVTDHPLQAAVAWALASVGVAVELRQAGRGLSLWVAGVATVVHLRRTTVQVGPGERGRRYMGHGHDRSASHAMVTALGHLYLWLAPAPASFSVMAVEPTYSSANLALIGAIDAETMATIVASPLRGRKARRVDGSVP